MALITESALAHVAYHVTLFRDLRIYIRSMKTKEELAFAVVASAFVVVAVSVDIAAIRLICPCMVAADCTAARNYSSADNIVDKSA